MVFDSFWFSDLFSWEVESSKYCKVNQGTLPCTSAACSEELGILSTCDWPHCSPGCGQGRTLIKQIMGI